MILHQHWPVFETEKLLGRWSYLTTFPRLSANIVLHIYVLRLAANFAAFFPEILLWISGWLVDCDQLQVTWCKSASPNGWTIVMRRSHFDSFTRSGTFFLRSFWAHPKPADRVQHQSVSALLLADGGMFWWGHILPDRLLEIWGCIPLMILEETTIRQRCWRVSQVTSPEETWLSRGSKEHRGDSVTILLFENH